MVTQTRYCAECGTEFTWTSTSPNRRFCDPRCKARWWRGRNGRAASAGDGTAPTGGGPAPRGTEPPGLGTAHACPNCGQQLTVVNVVVPVGDGPGRAGEEPLRRTFAADHG